MTAEGVQAAAKAAKQLSLREAEMILGVESGAGWQEVMKARSFCCRLLLAAAKVVCCCRRFCWMRAAG